LWNCGRKSEGASVVFKPRGAAVRQFAGKARSVYCSKQLRKSHPCHLYREGAYGSVCSRTGSHTCRAVFSPLVSTPSNWWLEVALMTTVRPGKCSARPRHTLTPLLTPTAQPRLGPHSNDTGAQRYSHVSYRLPVTTRHETTRSRLALNHVLDCIQRK
jgi:hypothetical protein